MKRVFFALGLVVLAGCTVKLGDTNPPSPESQPQSKPSPKPSDSAGASGEIPVEERIPANDGGIVRGAEVVKNAEGTSYYPHVNASAKTYFFIPDALEFAVERDAEGDPKAGAIPQVDLTLRVGADGTVLGGVISFSAEWRISKALRKQNADFRAARPDAKVSIPIGRPLQANTEFWERDTSIRPGLFLKPHKRQLIQLGGSIPFQIELTNLGAQFLLAVIEGRDEVSDKLNLKACGTMAGYGPYFERVEQRNGYRVLVKGRNRETVEFCADLAPAFETLKPYKDQIVKRIVDHG